MAAAECIGPAAIGAADSPDLDVVSGAAPNPSASAGTPPRRSGGAGAGSPPAPQVSLTPVTRDGLQGISREDLLEAGVPREQADAMMVRSNEEQVLNRHYRCCILSFTCLVILMLPVILGVFVWMVYEFCRYRQKECDVPLQTWCYIVWAVVVFNLFIRRFVIKCICRWEPSRENQQEVLLVPLRVKLLNISISVFMFVWTCIGLHWVRISGHIASPLPPCRDEASGLYESVRTYAATNLCFTVFLYAYLHGISRILASMMRAGMLQTSQAAPPGALERNTEVISMEHESLKDNPSCSVCLEDWSDKKEIILTRHCGHVFHKSCLKGWLKVQRSCPLCRKDLGHIGPT